MWSSLRNPTTALLMHDLITRVRSGLGPKRRLSETVLRCGWVAVCTYPISIVESSLSRAATCCGQWRKTCSTDSTSLPHPHSGLVENPILCKCSLSIVKSDLARKSFLSSLLLHVEMKEESLTLGWKACSFLATSLLVHCLCHAASIPECISFLLSLADTGVSLD